MLARIRVPRAGRRQNCWQSNLSNPSTGFNSFIFRRFPVALRTILLLGAFIAVAGATAQPANDRPPFPVIRLTRHYQGEEAITALADKLPDVARFYRKSPEELRATL